MGEPAQRIIEVVMEDHVCRVCGIVYAAPQDFWNARREERVPESERGFSCPNGHRSVFTDTEVSKLKRQLEAAQRDAEWHRQRAEHNRKRLSAQFGENTKLRKRINNGVCPCCHRHFANLERHLKGKHPDFTKEVAPAS